MEKLKNEVKEFVVEKTGLFHQAIQVLIVDEIKNRCPVFGKEIFVDGQYKWKENKK